MVHCILIQGGASLHYGTLIQKCKVESNKGHDGVGGGHNVLFGIDNVLPREATVVVVLFGSVQFGGEEEARRCDDSS